MNTNFKNYPRKAEIDAHGVDLINYKGEVVDNYGTYTGARYYSYKVSQGNHEKAIAHAENRRAHDAAEEANGFALRAYHDALAMYERIKAHNAAHPDKPIPQIHKPTEPKLLEVPELHKQARKDGLPMLRWYEVGKAPIEVPA